MWDIRMRAGRTRRCRLAPRFEIRRRTTVLLAALAMAIAAMAAAQTNTATTTFKAGGPAIAVPTRGAPVQAWEVRSIDFQIAAAWSKGSGGPVSIVRLTAPSGRFELAFDLAAQKLLVIATPRGKKPVSDSRSADISDGKTHHLAVGVQAVSTQIWLDGTPLEPVWGIGFDTSDDLEKVTVEIGGGDFAGTLGSLRIWSTLLDDAAVAQSKGHPDVFPVPGFAPGALTLGQKTGQDFVRASVPVVGLWHQDGAIAGTADPRPKKLPGIETAHHGQFEDDETFFALAQGDGDNVIVADSRGRSRTLQPVAGSHGRYVVVTEAGTQTGVVVFEPGGNRLQVGKSADDFLLAGKHYKVLVRPDDGEGTQKFGDAWNKLAKPDSFQYSVLGCFDSRDMDWGNFAERGCEGHFFRQPPDDSRRFSDVEGTNKIVPWGWRYYNLPGGEAYSYARLTENASDVGKSIVGGSGFSFDLVGIAFNHNENIQTETKNVVNSKKMRSYFTHTQRAHSTVVDARNIRMGQCFIKDVMRATFALTNTLPEPPRWFDEDDSGDGRCDQTLTEGISPKELIDNYGTHYGYAITYGSRLIRWANITAEEVGTFASEKRDVRDGLDYHFKANLSAPGVPISMEGTAKAGLTSTSGQSTWNNIQDKVETDASFVKCAGGKECTDVSANTDNDPVPIYLDLRPMTDLLGPPYFLDPMVNITLRRAVQAELDKMMVQPVDDFPLLRFFDVNITSLNCDLVNYGTTPLSHAATMSQVGQGPFAPGGPFAARTDLVPYMAVGITTLAQATNSFNRACDTLRNTAVLQVEGVLPNGQTGLMSISGHPLLKNLVSSQHTPSMTIRTPFLTSPGFKFHFRLRKQADQDLDTCPAPCAVEVPGSEVPSVTMGKPPTAKAGFPPYYLVYPQFEYLGLDQITPGTNALNRVVGRGVSNYLLYDQNTMTFPLSTLPPAGYTVLILGTITPKDLSAELGY